MDFRSDSSDSKGSGKKQRERIFPDNMSSSENRTESNQNSQIENQTPSTSPYIKKTQLKSKKNLSIEEELQFINNKYRSILQSQGEQILYRPVKAYKLKPKNIMRMFQAKWRYVMFTNRRLYTLDSDAYEDGTILKQDRLITNNIDIDFLSHLIFIPKFIFDSIELFDVAKVKNDHQLRRQAIAKEMKQKPCKIIIGFKTNVSSHYKFNESDIALETTMWTVLQLIHACQLVNMQDQVSEFMKQGGQSTKSKSKISKNNQGESQKREGRFNRLTVDTENNKSQRGKGSKRSNSQKLDQIQYFPVFIVKNKKYSSDATEERTSMVMSPRSDKSRKSSRNRSKSGFRDSLTRLFSSNQENFNLKQFYRSKTSEAEMKINDYPDILQRVDTKYFCELFWALEPQSYPPFIKQITEQLEMQSNQPDQQPLHSEENSQLTDNKNNYTGVFGNSNMGNTITVPNTGQIESTGNDPRKTSNEMMGQPSPTSQDNIGLRTSIKTMRQNPGNKPESSLIQSGQPVWDNFSNIDSSGNNQRGINNLVAKAAALNQQKNNSNSNPRTEVENSSKAKVQSQTYNIPYFTLEDIRSHKPFILPSGSLKDDIQVGKYKIYKPFIMQNLVQLEFRNGDFMYLGVRISRPLQNIHSREVQQFVYEKSQVFDEELIDIFPVLSQPKIFLREQSTYESNKNQHHREVTMGTPSLQHSLYFGFLIPKFKKTLPLDLNNLQNYIGFKHGLMLLYQFLDFMIRIHKKDFKFGHFDLSNLYFVENRGDQNNTINHYLNSMPSRKQSTQQRGPQYQDSSISSHLKVRSGTSGTKNTQNQRMNFSLEFLFIEKNLQNLAIIQNNQVLNQSYLNRFISQVTETDQKQFVESQIDPDFFCIGRRASNHRERTSNNSRSKSKSAENRWSQRSKSPQSISPYILDQFKNEIRQMQNKIDNMQPNFDKNSNKVEIESLQVFIQILLQYCHRIKGQANGSVSPTKKDSKAIESSQQIKLGSNISQPLSHTEETFEFLRRKDDVMRQTFYFEFMSCFNSNQVRNFSPAHQQLDHSQSSGYKMSNSRISMPQSISNFEDKIFEKQLADAQKLCRKFIDIYENKEYWQLALAQYIEDSQKNELTSHKDADKIETPAIGEDRHSFVSFSNQSNGSRAFVAQSQQFPSLINQNNVLSNRYKTGSMSVKKTLLTNAKKSKNVQAHMALLDDMLNMSNNFDNLLVSPRSDKADGRQTSQHDSKITSNKTQFSGESIINMQSQDVTKKDDGTKNSPRKGNNTKHRRNNKNASGISMEFNEDNQTPNDSDLPEETKRNNGRQLSPEYDNKPSKTDSSKMDAQNMTQQSGKQKIIPKQNPLKDNLQRFDQVSCQEGLESIVSGAGASTVYGSYIGSNKNAPNIMKQFGTISGIGGAGEVHRKTIRQKALETVEEANEKLRSNEKVGRYQKGKQLHQGQDTGNSQRSKTGAIHNIQEEPISEDDEEDDGMNDQQLEKQKQHLEAIKNKKKEKAKAMGRETKSPPQDDNKARKSQKINKSNGIVHMVPALQQKSRISSDKNTNQSQSRVSRFSNPSRFSQLTPNGESKVKSDGSHPSLSPRDAKARGRLKSDQSKVQSNENRSSASPERYGDPKLVSRISKLSKERSSILQNSKLTSQSKLSKVSKDSVLVSSPGAHNRKQSTKLKNLKEKKSNKLRDDVSDKQGYEEEMNDMVDDQMPMSDRSHKTHIVKNNRDPASKGTVEKKTSQIMDNRMVDTKQQQSSGILKNQRYGNKGTQGHRFSKVGQGAGQQNDRFNKNQNSNSRNDVNLANQKSQSSMNKFNSPVQRGGLNKARSPTSNFLGAALESQNQDSMAKQLTSRNQKTNFRTEAKDKTLSPDTSQKRPQTGGHREFKQRQFDLQSQGQNTTQSNNQQTDLSKRKSFRGQQRSRY